MRIQVIPDDIKAAYRLHIFPRSRFVAATGLLLLVAFYALAITSVTKIMGGDTTWQDWIAVLAAAYIPVWYFILLPASIKKMYSQAKALHEPIEMTVGQDGLAATGPNGEGTIPWTHVHRWRESRHVLLIYFSDELYHVVPKRCLDHSQEEILRTALLKNVGPANNSFKPRPLRGSA